MTDFSGEIHPYLADLPVFDSEVDLVAESIAEVGLLHAITLDDDGRLIGGRHRLAACERAGVEPVFETYDGDPLAFILHDNATRKHQTTGQRAAEVALSLHSAGKRADGRWKYGDLRDELTNSGQSRQRVRDCGLILDFLGRDALVEVAADDRTLNDAYEAALKVKNAEDERLAAAAREAEAEAKAEEFVRDVDDPTLIGKVEAGDHTWREARALWEVRNAEEAAQRREIEKGIKDALNHVTNALQYLDGGADDAQRFIEHNLPKHDDYLQGPRALTPQRLDAGIDFLTELRKARA